MKQIIILFIAVFIAIGSLCYFAFISGEKNRETEILILKVQNQLSFKSGQESKQKEIENRAKKINKECFTNSDIEQIIFNEEQL